MIPYAKYPGLPPLFLDFLKGLPEFYPDPPTLDAAVARGRELLQAKARPRFPPSAFRLRGDESARLAGELAAGRAVAVSTGHQVGLFTGPLFTLMKAFDAIHVARELSRRGVPAVPVFWALTDDHDLQEVARTARPSADGPQVLVLEGADRQNRRPVGQLPIPEAVGGIVEAFRPDARNEDGARILDAFAARSAPGSLYGDAFIETLLDLVDPDPLLVLEPLSGALRAPTVELFLEAVLRQKEVRKALLDTEQRLKRAGKTVAAAVPDSFSFFAIDAEGRRRIEDLAGAAARVRAGDAIPSADVITRPALKSYLFPMAASVLGAAEIAYHAQSLPLFSILGIQPPVLLPRTHVVLRGPAERRLARSLGLAEEDLLSTGAGAAPADPPEASEIVTIARAAEDRLVTLSGQLERLDASLLGALDTAKRKIAYQFESLAERARKAAERREDVAVGRHKRLERLLLPGGVPAERLFSPLTPLLAHGHGIRDALRRASGHSTEGAAVLDVGSDEAGGTHAG